MRPLLFTACWLILPLTLASAEEQALTRWALIPADGVAESGLLDLLTVELSKNDSLQLVERERLQDAMRELQLTALVQAGDAQPRLQLGKILRAHALMVLSFERQRDRRLLRLTVCDASLGVRLWRGDFACAEKPNLEELVRHCVATVGEIRQRFAGGIRHIVAVPPLVSENFELRFDDLQTRYRDQLAAALVVHPGVAVVEIEEARAILREWETTLSGGLERPIALIVNGSYRVAPDESGRHQVTLSMELARGNSRSEHIEKTLALAGVTRWLVQDLARRLVDAAEGRRPALSAQAQTEILSRHAGRFAVLGNWEHSISLRETALILAPNDALARALAISEYQYAFLPKVDQNWHTARFAKPLPLEPRERALRIAAHDYCLSLDHLAYLIRNRLLGRADAIGMLRKQTWYKPQAVGAALPRDSLLYRCLQPACEAQRTFLRDVYPLVEELPQGRRLPAHLSEPAARGPDVVAMHVASDVVFHNYDTESLDSLKDLLTRDLPDQTRTSDTILGLFTSANVPKPEEARFAAWSELIAELSSSQRDIGRLYARFALAMEHKQQQKSGAALEQLLVDLKGTGRADEPIVKVTNLQLMRPPAQAPTLPTAPLPRGFGPLGRLQLEPIKLVVEGEQTEPPILGMLRCGERDAYWTKDRFFIMDRPGALRELRLTDATTDHALFGEVCWDGACIWLHAHGVGIVVVQPDGTRLASFQNLLPNYSKSHKLLGLSPRRALMVGSFGETHRAWAGLLEVNEHGQASAKIFFQAKHVAEGRSDAQASADPTTAFQPDGLSQVRHADGRQYALVERRGLSPLQIDLQTLEVSIPAEIRAESGASTRSDLGFLGRLFLRDGRPVQVPSGVAVSPNSRHLVFHDGWLYRPGLVWMREHAETRTLERLQAAPLPSGYWNLRVGASAHYGLVTYDPHNHGPSLFRVTILDQPRGR